MIYDIARAKTPDMLIERVNKLQKEDWSPLGGISIGNDTYFQAMCQYPEMDNADEEITIDPVEMTNPVEMDLGSMDIESLVRSLIGHAHGEGVAMAEDDTALEAKLGIRCQAVVQEIVNRFADMEFFKTYYNGKEGITPPDDIIDIPF